MKRPNAGARRHLPSSPFQPAPERETPVFDVGDRVTHDRYGLGRVVSVEDRAVVVDFGAERVRLVPPYAKLSKL